jgi:hypothetical protein
LLTGRLFDDRGNRMSPSHVRKGGLKYRYYLSSALFHGAAERAGSECRPRSRRWSSFRSLGKRQYQGGAVRFLSLIECRKGARLLAIASLCFGKLDDQLPRLNLDSCDVSMDQAPVVNLLRWFEMLANRTRPADTFGKSRHLGRVDRPRAPLAR